MYIQFALNGIVDNGGSVDNINYNEPDDGRDNEAFFNILWYTDLKESTVAFSI